MDVLEFKLIEKGQWAYLLWPWKEPAEFLYAMLQYGAKYEIGRHYPRNKDVLLEIRPIEGVSGEYFHDLFFGRTPEGNRIYRRFPVQGSHYITQHGLDGIAKDLWDSAYEYRPGEPQDGRVRIKFRVELKKEGGFSMTFHDWMSYFVSGKNGHIRNMGIEISPRRDSYNEHFSFQTAGTSRANEDGDQGHGSGAVGSANAAARS